jgi:DNA polymerase III delta subunit
VSEQLPPEFDLVDALLAGDRESARKIAAELHQRGFDYATIGEALKEYPHLEEPLWELLQEVTPIPRRVAKRRAIRAAEERDWGDWKEGKKKL